MKLTRKQVARLFDISIRTVTTWQADPAFPKPTKEGGVNHYDGPAVLRWWRDREIASLIETDDGALLDLDQERARLAKAQRERVELELRVRREELVGAAAVRRQLARSSQAVRDGILAVPHRVAPVVAAETDPDKVFARLVDELVSSLTALADNAPSFIEKTEAETEETGNGNKPKK